MKSSVLIEIEHTKYMKLIDLDEQTSNTALITTVKEDQKRAIIKLVGKKEGLATVHLGEYEINLPYEYQNGSKRPKISINSRLEGKTLYVDGVLDGRQLFSDKLPVRQLLPKPNWAPIAGAVIGGIAVILLLVWLFSFLAVPSGSSSSSGTPKGSGTASSATSGKTAVAVNPSSDKANSASAALESAGTNDTVSAAGGETPADLQPAAAEPEATQSPTAIPTQKPSPTPEPEPFIPEGTIAKTVYFEPNISTLTDEAKASLREMLDDLETYTDADIRIWGHCAIKGTEEGRELLSMERAENVKKYLTSLGFNSDHIDLRWFAGTKPVTEDEDKQYLNRRVEVAILGR